MSQTQSTHTNDDCDPWEQLAGKRDALEMVIEEDLPYAPYARNLLDELDERGYGK